MWSSMRPNDKWRKGSGRRFDRRNKYDLIRFRTYKERKEIELVIIIVIIQL